jgi:hypothetical protein
VTRCHVCERPLELDDRDDDGRNYEVVLRNRLVFTSCFSCWFKWPDPWKRFPANGYGCSAEVTNGVGVGDFVLVDLLGGPA